MDAGTLQSNVRSSMVLPDDQVNEINVRLMEHMREGNLSVPMLRLVHFVPREGSHPALVTGWHAVTNIHRFYAQFRHVLEFKRKPINDAALSLALSDSNEWHRYVMGLFTYLKQHSLRWIVTRARVVFTLPQKKPKGFFDQFVDSYAHPPAVVKGKVTLRALDYDAVEYLIRVDLGLSHLAAVTTAEGHAQPASSSPRAAAAPLPVTRAESPQPLPPSAPANKKSRSSSSSSSSESDSDSGEEMDSDEFDKDFLALPLPPKETKSQEQQHPLAASASRTRFHSLPDLGVIKEARKHIRSSSEEVLSPRQEQALRAAESAGIKMSPRKLAAAAPPTVVVSIETTKSGLTIARRRSAGAINMQATPHASSASMTDGILSPRYERPSSPTFVSVLGTANNNSGNNNSVVSSSSPSSSPSAGGNGDTSVGTKKTRKFDISGRASHQSKTYMVARSGDASATPSKRK
jgi:hypothetical protein